MRTRMSPALIWWTLIRSMAEHHQKNHQKKTGTRRPQMLEYVGYGEIMRNSDILDICSTFVQHFDWRMPSNCGHHPQISLWKSPRSCCWVTSEPWMGTKEFAVTYSGLMPWLEHQVEILLEFDSGANQQPAQTKDPKFLPSPDWISCPVTVLRMELVHQDG